MTDKFTVPSIFSFSVSFIEDGTDADEAGFQEASGLELESRIKPLVEAGEDEFLHRLPNRVRHQNLILKHGLVKRDGALIRWCRSVLESDFSQPIEPKALRVSLLGQDAIAVAEWHLLTAFPVKLDLGGIGSADIKLSVETIEIAYSDCKRVL